MRLDLKLITASYILCFLCFHHLLNSSNYHPCHYLHPLSSWRFGLFWFIYIKKMEDMNPSKWTYVSEPEIALHLHSLNMRLRLLKVLHRVLSQCNRYRLRDFTQMSP